MARERENKGVSVNKLGWGKRRVRVHALRDAKVTVTTVDNTQLGLRAMDPHPLDNPLQPLLYGC